MKVGDLVETTRARIGVPAGTIGLVTNVDFNSEKTVKYIIVLARWFGKPEHERMWIPEYLKVVS